jgi:hypothetical protein
LPRDNLPLFCRLTVLLGFEVTNPSVTYTMRTINLELPVRNVMRTINLELPDGLHERVQELAQKNEVTINLMVATALVDTILMPHNGRSSTEHNQEKEAL